MTSQDWLPYPSALAQRLLVSTSSVSNLWRDQNTQAINELHTRVCEDIMRVTDTQAEIEWQSYGSGYASFVDAWFYRPNKEFASTPIPGSESYTGLVVLLCRLVPGFAFMEGSKSWNKRGSSSYLPAFEQVDDLRTPAVQSMSLRVQPILQRAGLQRLGKAELAASLSSDIEIETNLGDPPYREFDALFHWMD